MIDTLLFSELVRFPLLVQLVSVEPAAVHSVGAGPARAKVDPVDARDGSCDSANRAKFI